jgi:glycosyltransferase involved in cell wall biosynthesis
VTVFAQPPNNSIWDLPHSNPRFCFYREFELDTYDIAIVWRHLSNVDLARRVAKQVFFWPHDIAVKGSYIIAQWLTGICYLSDYQRRQWVTVYPELADVENKVCGNGYDPQDFPLAETLDQRDPYLCVYASNYGRGLSELIKIWPIIHKEHPKLKLDIYYGREVWGAVSEAEAQEIIKQLESLKDSNVQEMGKVSHKNLAKVFQQASFLLYPCTKEETFCITAVKAQAGGCIPVITRLGALVETVSPEAFVDDIGGYLPLVRKALSAPPEELARRRAACIKFVRGKFTWSHSVDRAIKFLE